MPEKGLADAILVLMYLQEHYPELDRMCNHGKLEVTFKDGVVYSIGPFPYLVRGKDFRVETKKRVY